LTERTLGGVVKEDMRCWKCSG